MLEIAAGIILAGIIWGCVPAAMITAMLISAIAWMILGPFVHVWLTGPRLGCGSVLFWAVALILIALAHH